jgi:hypothetical protein
VRRRAEGPRAHTPPFPHDIANCGNGEEMQRLQGYGQQRGDRVVAGTSNIDKSTPREIWIYSKTDKLPSGRLAFYLFCVPTCGTHQTSMALLTLERHRKGCTSSRSSISRHYILNTGGVAQSAARY